MGLSMSPPPLRRWPGHGVTLIAIALLALFAVHALTSTFHEHDLDTTESILGSDGEPRRASSHEEDGCEGSWDICCWASRSSKSGVHNAVFSPAAGQQPMVLVGNRFVASYAATKPPSTMAKNTMKFFGSLLTVAAGAWCSRLAIKPWTSSSPSSSSPAHTCTATMEWPGFSGMEYVFSFGDSFTSTWFNWRDNPPSPSTPLGNPPYPGYTSASGPNWIDYLTIRYNQSLLKTYNIAIGGASVDQDIQLSPPFFGQNLRDPFEPERRSLKDQVLRDFIAGYFYKNAPEAPDWNSGNSLFTIWIGINDVVGSYARGPDGPEGTKALNERIFGTYTQLTEILYSHGARNFVFLNVPAVDRSPVITERGPRDVVLLAADLNDFNNMVTKMAWDLKHKYDGINAWVYDSRADFNRVLNDPHAFRQTSGLKNLTDTCDKYGLIWPIPNADLYFPECGVRLAEYFWRDGLHPTSAIHEVVADELSKLLQATPNVCGSTVSIA